MSFTVREGTDTSFPSVRVTIDGYEDAEGNPTEREIALVFRNDQDADTITALIDSAVDEYVERSPRDNRGRARVPDRVLNHRGNR